MARVSLLLFALLFAVALGVPQTCAKNIVCYFGSWSNYRQGDGKFTAENIDPFLCTHLIYSFFGINTDGTLRVMDPWLDLQDNSGLGMIKRFNDLKLKNPALKTLAAVGGWNEGSAKFSQVAASATLRTKFAVEVAQFLIKYGFDGFDVDWEYPAQRDGNPTIDKDNFVLFLSALRTELQKYNFLLTTAVAASSGSASLSYKIPNMAQLVDMINIMDYDFHGSWESVTGHNAPLYAAGPSDTSNLNVHASIQYWLAQGAPAAKINLGVPFYGRTFTLTNANQNGVGAPTSGPGQAGQFTGEAGFLGYNEICLKSWTRVFDNQAKTVYAYSGNQWVTYDDAESLLVKCNYIKQYGLGGGMLWSIETDDFLGRCGTKYILLNTLKNCLNGASPATTTLAVQGTTTTVKPGTTTTVKPGTTTTVKPATTTTVKPTTQVTNGGAAFVCPGPSGYYRDPVDCAKFYYCNGTTKYTYTCATGTYFNTNLSVCDWPANVQC